jgi:hypothetical protein
VSIIAIIRGDQAITAPQPSEILRVGDRLVVVSRPQDLVPEGVLLPLGRELDAFRQGNYVRSDGKVGGTRCPWAHGPIQGKAIAGS